jgi:hypothetical protein
LFVNGRLVSGEFVKAEALQSANRWEVFLAVPAVGARVASHLRKVDVSNESEIFAPAPPVWDNAGQGGLTLEGGRIVLNYRQENAAKVTFTIYRDGELCAENVRQTKWTDPLSGDDQDRVHTYSVAAVDPSSGNVSHLSPSRSYGGEEQVIPASALRNRGGTLVANQYFENWGKVDDELVTTSFGAKRGGRYQVRVRFSNGAGPINTGITCAVKKLEVRKAGSPELVASGYLVMPQSGDWKRWTMSNAIDADLEAGAQYNVRLTEDDYSRNMSYLKKNERYTAGPGGGDASYNFVNISSVSLRYSGPPKREYTATSASP